MAISRSRTAEVRMVERVRIVLACLEGKEIRQVAQQVGASLPTVSKWRSRFARDGIRGLRDGRRSGKPPIYGMAFRDRVLALLEQAPPAGQAQWDGPAVAKRLGASVHAVWRVLRREGIYLQRLRTWCVSTDPEFAAKAAEVVGLYLNPPLNALVLSVDEKPGIQAVRRASGYVETDSGAIVTADALNCQRAIAQQIVEQKGDYALALKTNQGTLYDDVVLLLDDPESKVTTAKPVVEADHGRIETRMATVSTEIDWLEKQHQWPGLKAIGKVVRARQTAEKTTTETAYNLLSRVLSPERFNEVVRQHWGIGNSSSGGWMWS